LSLTVDKLSSTKGYDLLFYSLSPFDTMKNLSLLFTLLSLSLFIFSCDDDGLGDGEFQSLVANNPGDQAEIGIVNGGLYNGDMEILNNVEPNLPSGWDDGIFSFQPPNNYEFSHEENITIDDRSARISVSNIDNLEESAFFTQSIRNVELPIGALVRLRAYVRTQDLAGGGFAMFVVGADADGNTTDQFGNFLFRISSFQETRFVSGTTNWTEYTTDIASLPAGIETLDVFLNIRPSTIGDIFFDNVVLEFD